MIPDTENVTGFFEREGIYYVIKDDSEKVEESHLKEIQNLRIYDPLRGIYHHRVTGENVFPFNYGPSTGGMVETVDFKIYTYGERILSLDVIPDFKKRVMKFSGSSFERGLLMMERFNGFHSFSYSTLLAREIERKLDLVVTGETVKIRLILLEIERIISHIFKTARLCEAASQNIASYWLLALRERMMRAVATETGHRYMFGVNRIGGIGRKINVTKIVDTAKEVVSEYRRIIDGLTVSRIFIDRIENTCKIEEKFQRGPVLRAAGISYDYRSFDPYYKESNFKPVTEDGGDSLSRFLVFSAEVFSSLQLIEDAVSRKFEDFKGETYDALSSSGIETPSGDARIVLDVENEKIGKLYVRTPSLLNMEAFALGIKGNVKTDIPFAFESFGIWLSEMGDIE
ncbi:MAG: hypothetical protein M1427_05290 [Candidatus Thermoplasmatota archaeon]|nr:hypothetical protein [Candidatus Thermoplasmatota archaeon]MCL5787443.1 hypothetical protein [Candidatus Thermoplasmatota archaeon]